MKSIEEVREFFAKDRFATQSGATIQEIGDNYAKCTMDITPDHLNAAGIVMGGAIFTLADFAFAVASNWNKGLHVSWSSQITFLNVAKGSTLISEATAVTEGRAA